MEHRNANQPGQITPLSLQQRVRAREPEAWHKLVQLYRR